MIFLYLDLNFNAWLSHNKSLNFRLIWPYFFIVWQIFEVKQSRHCLTIPPQVEAGEATLT